MIWSYAHHAVELLRLVVTLSEEDRLVLAVPQIRLLLELAMTSIWLYLNPDNAAGALIHEDLRQKKATVDEALKAGHEQLRDLVARLEAEQAPFLGDASREGQYIAHRFKAIDGGSEMYPLYRVLCGDSHATARLADFYLENHDRDKAHPLGIVLNPDAKLDSHESTLGIAISMTLCALKACDLVDAKGRRKSQLAKAAKRFGITLEFRLAASEKSASGSAKTA